MASKNNSKSVIKSPFRQPTVYEVPGKTVAGVVYDKNLRLITVIVCGHVDAGKSTITGQLLISAKMVDEHALKQIRVAAEADNKLSFVKARICDTNPDQRLTGKTMTIKHVELCPDYTTANGNKVIANNYITMIDAPGHSDYIRNMITGATQADVAMAIVDAEDLYSKLLRYKKALDEGQDPDQVERPINEQNSSLPEHLIICRGLGVTKCIMVLNKMDVFKEGAQRTKVYNELKEYLIPYLSKKFKFKIEPYTFIPVSGREGLGFTEPISGIETTEEIPALMEVLAKTDFQVEDSGAPFRMHIEQLLKDISGTNVVATGKVQSGKLHPGDKLEVTPYNLKVTARAIEMHHKAINEAYASCNIGVDLKDFPKKKEQAALYSKNAILAHPEAKPKVTKRFKAKVLAVKMLANDGLTVGLSRVVVHFASGVTTCCKLESILNPVKVGEKGEKTSLGRSADAILANTAAEIIFESEKEIPVDSRQTHAKNAHFIMREGACTLGWGAVTQVDPEEYIDEKVGAPGAQDH